MDSEDVIEDIARQGEEEHAYFIVAQRIADAKSFPPLFLQKLDPQVLQPIATVEIRGRIAFRKAEFPLRRGRIGNVRVLWGDTELLGGRATLLASKVKEGIEKGSFRVKGADEWPLLKDDEGCS